VTVRNGIRVAALGLALGVLLVSGPPAVAGDEAAAAPDLSKVTFKSPDDRLWKVGTHEGNDQALLIQFVPQGESIDEWNSLVTMQEYTLTEGRFPGADEAAKLLEKRMRARCPEVDWEMVNQTAWSVTYRWHSEGCALQPNESEIARVMVSPSRTVRIAYTVRPGPLSPADRLRLEDWLAGFTPKGP
jgi:hypothetical protein